MPKIWGCSYTHISTAGSVGPPRAVLGVSGGNSSFARSNWYVGLRAEFAASYPVITLETQTGSTTLHEAVELSMEGGVQVGKP